MCYRRIPTAELFNRGLSADPVWIAFLEDPAVNKLKDNEPTGCALVNIGLLVNQPGPLAGREARSAWDSDLISARTRSPCEIRVRTSTPYPLLNTTARICRGHR